MPLQPLRVLCLTRAYGIQQGGMERLSFELIEQLQQQSDLDVTILAHTGSRLGILWFFLKTLPMTWLKAGQVDVVHLGDPLLALHGWLLKNLWRKPVAVTVHGLDVVYPNPLYKLYLRLFFRHLTAYWPISQYAQTLLQTEWQPTGPITVIWPAIHDRWYQPTYTRADLQYVLQHSLTADHKVFLTSGRLIKRKGVAWFITEVLPKLPATVLYVIAGAGPEEEAIKEAVAKHQLQDRVILLGRVSEADLQILYNTVDAFIQPNIQVPHDGEGFGLVLAEAALCARPIFAANLEGIPDIIRDKQNGTLLPSGDSQAWLDTLQRWLENPTTWQPTGAAAREYTLHHDVWPVRIGQYVAALKQLVRP